MTRERIGAMLMARGLVSEDDLAHALAFQASHAGRLGAALVKMGAVSEAALYEVLSVQLGYPLTDSAKLRSDAVAAAWAHTPRSRQWMLQMGVIPWLSEAGELIFGCSDPLDNELRESLAQTVDGTNAQWHLLQPTTVERWVARLLELETANGPLDAAALKELAEDAPVIAFVNNVLAQAVDARASDIHLEPGEQEFSIRFRVDGVLLDQTTAPMSRYPAIASRIKLISHLDIAERRLPQDGRVTVRAAGQEMDIRVSAIPAVHGESIVMRLLPKQRGDLSLKHLGMSPHQLAVFQRWLDWPNGLVLVTGPTGSGKSTTLYSALSAISDSTRKIVTVEDPVEFRLPNVIQIQTQAEIGYTFARALRSILRHDPDIIMVGEIRDRETAEIAIQAALTGHLVLATLHTNDAMSAITRLTDMGIEPYLVAAALRATMAQRLVRRLCVECAQASEPPPGALARLARLAQIPELGLDASPGRWARAIGCATCGKTGFKGRVGIYELVTIGEALQHGIAAGKPLSRLIAQADEAGRLSLLDDGLLKAAAAATTYDEVLRAAGNLDHD